MCSGQLGDLTLKTLKGQPFSMPYRPLVGPLAASFGDHLGTSPRLKNTQLMFPKFFFVFRGVRGGVFPKDSMTLRPSRWLAVAA